MERSLNTWRRLLIASLFVVAAACTSTALESTSTSVISFQPPPGHTPVPASQAKLLELGSLRQYPERLLEPSPLADSEVRDLLHTFVAGSRILSGDFVDGTPTLVELCPNGWGVWVVGTPAQQDLVGKNFKWQIAHGVGDRWNQPRLDMTFPHFPENHPEPGVFVSLSTPDSSGKLRWVGFGSLIGVTNANTDPVELYDTRSNSCSRFE